MYAHNLFTLNNVPTLSVGGGLGALMQQHQDSMPVRCHDVIFVRVVQYGRTLIDRTFTGFSCMPELMRAVKDCLGGTVGLVSVYFRNSSCGCASKRVIRMNRPTVSMPARYAE